MFVELGAMSNFTFLEGASHPREIVVAAVDHLHVVGDIYDRGNGADIIIDELRKFHSFDIQWGNHDVLWMGDMVDKFQSFGWFVQKVNGHDIDASVDAIAACKAQQDKPVMIILDTIKGNGCELAEQTFPCHHIKFSAEQIAPSIAKAEAVLAEVRKA